MNIPRISRPLLSFLAFTFASASFAAPPPQTEIFRVDGVRREALVYATANAPAAGAPLVLVFHGHGGNVRHAASSLRVHLAWPDATVVYLQGLPGVPGITDPAGVRTGWQKNPGDQGNRDLRFVDAVLSGLPRKYRVDSKRVYALGHSNGARFVHVLWDQRPAVFAAFCSGAAQGGPLIRGNAPRSILMMIGENDPLVPAAGQLLSIDLARRVLQSDPDQAEVDGFLSTEPGVAGTELATYIHPGGHEFPFEAVKAAVGLFARHRLD